MRPMDATRTALVDIGSLARALRPRQWLKNLLLFAAPAAAGALTQSSVATRAVSAFVAFCLVSSSVYLLNDIVDATADRSHPTKRYRPVASGALSPRTALVAAGALLAAGAAFSGVLGARFALVVGIYVVLMVAYSLALKYFVIIDIATVACGFVLRAVAGGFAANVPNSKWFLLLTSLGALFVVSGKRYADVLERSDAGANGDPAAGAVTSDPGSAGHRSRRSYRGTRRGADYAPSFLRFVWIAASTLAIAAYCLWTFSAHDGVYSILVNLSIVPFVLAILRYAWLVDSGRGGRPEALFTSDRMLVVLIVIWLAVYGSGVYLGT
jgi:decaprenyl-phosphate phosphoribosyltransferase